MDVSNQEAPSDLRNFSMGDNVKVSSGDLLGLQGKITGIDDKNITMQPMHEDLKVIIIIEVFSMILLRLSFYLFQGPSAVQIRRAHQTFQGWRSC